MTQTGMCRKCRKPLEGIPASDIHERESGFVKLCSKECADAWDEFEDLNDQLEHDTCNHPTMWEDD